MQTVAVQPLNAVVGDAGFIAQYGRLPASTDGSVSRIRAHLAFVEERLRKATAAYPPEVAERRLRHLDTLAAYREAGVFPRITEEDMASLEAMRSLDGVQRLPCFIDRAGTHCAVGHLMARSGEEGPAVSEAMDGAHHWDYLLEVDASGLPESVQAWVASCGFSLTELAMIQPTYDFRRRHPVHDIGELRKVPDDEHTGVTCDVCNTSPIRGIRWKCATCDNFDLCANCEANFGDTHGHPLFKIRRRDANFGRTTTWLCAACLASNTEGRSDHCHACGILRGELNVDILTEQVLPADPIVAPPAHRCSACLQWRTQHPGDGGGDTQECQLCTEGVISADGNGRWDVCCTTCATNNHVCQTCGSPYQEIVAL